MDRSTLLVYATAATIVGVTLVSGPAVGLVDLTSPRFDTSGLGQGTVTVDRVEPPDRIVLGGSFQSESYRLQVPDTSVTLSDIEGKPILTYWVEIDALGYNRVSTYFLDESNEGARTLSVDSATLGGDDVTEDRYNATLSLVVRANGNETTVYRSTVPVEVTS